MIKLTTLSILGQPNSIFDLKKLFYKAVKNMPAVSEDLLRMAWESTKTALIIWAITWDYMKSLYLSFSNFTVNIVARNIIVWKDEQ